ncbi:MAG TPA: hypothetical protein VM536_20335 [Chloroflexia bacterium]|nr:hypothetical protein [Chloroflexia bacterium]
MSGGADALATDVEQANAALLSEIEQCSERHWRDVTAQEGRAAGVPAYHRADSDGQVARILQRVAARQPARVLTWAAINQGNAEQDRQDADSTRHKSAALLRDDGAAARRLRDVHLDTPPVDIEGPPLTAQQAIEGIVARQVHQHRASMQAAGQS